MTATPFDLSPADLQRELLDLAGRLGRGMRTLSALKDVRVGTTPRELIHTEDKLSLYRYTPVVEAPLPVPVLIVYALVNRPYMADLQPDRSLIGALLAQGLDVYLIDWGRPDAGDRGLGLADYVEGYLDRCLDRVSARSGGGPINVLGICQGGVLALCHAALHPEKVRTLITTVTPVDFHTPEDTLSHLARGIDVDLLVDATGNVPGAFLNWLFLSLKPFRLGSAKYVDLLDAADDPEALANFLRMERWISDSPDQAGACFAEFVRECYQGNALIAGTLTLGGRRVDLGRLTMPVLNIYARDDHLVPPAASRALARHVGSADYREIEFPGGHIGIYVSARARESIPPAVGDWLRARCAAP